TWAVGEIYIGGIGLARGYWNDPKKTAARFVVDPAGERLYRTGDLGRYLPDGDVEFAGRADVQLKIRGFRVEPGEIEAALKQHRAVEDAVVVAREDGRGESSLVAYWVARQGTATPAELRAFLGGSLPDFMVPAAFVRLPAIPLTPNRKVDRRALPAPGRDDLGIDAAGDGAMTPAEELLAGLWSDLLGLAGVGRESRFFELGGHSLLLTRLASRVRDAFGVDLPLRRYFECPTLAALTREIETARAGRLPLRNLPVTPRPPGTGDLPLSFAQERLWFLQRLAPESPVFVLPRVLRIRGALSVPALSGALGEVVRRHEALRTAFPVRQTPVQAVSPAVSPALPLADLRGLPPPAREAEARRVLAAAARRPFELAADLPVRALALRAGDEEHFLGLAVHHLVADGWSMRIVLHELATLYASRPLPEPPLQYADFTLWQRAWMQGEVLAADLAYWRERLEGTPAGLDLPADRPRPREVTYRGGRLPAWLPAPQLAGLDLLGRRDGATLFMVLLAGFAALLCRSTGRNDVVVGSPVSNRSRAELEGVVGLLVNTLALRVRLDERRGFADLLRTVRDVALGAYDHQDLPFEKLVESLHPERDLARPPLFQTLLVLQDLPRPATDVAGLRFAEEAVENGSAQLDLSLYAARDEGGLLESWEYSADLFDATTVARMAAHLHVLLAAAVAEPRLPLADLPLLSEAEAHQLLVAWNDTAAGIPELDGVHRWIERQAVL
ncbi:MAG TPA: condensation domain-containing protein, partial [Thermoanaerobaculia bacterium]|nr:condensation domain-containing protein [Thermoanaerobaculia bacterium]